MRIIFKFYFFFKFSSSIKKDWLENVKLNTYFRNEHLKNKLNIIIEIYLLLCKNYKFNGTMVFSYIFEEPKLKKFALLTSSFKIY